MVEILTDMINREWNLINTDADDYYGTSNNNNHSHHSRVLSRKISDNNSNNQHHPTSTDYNDVSSLAPIRTSKPSSNHMNLDIAYDTDGAIGTSTNRSKHRHHNDSNNNHNNYEFLISPRFSSRRHGTQPVKTVANVPLQQRLSHKTHLSATKSLNSSQNHVDRDEDSNNEDAAHHRHSRLSRRVRQTPTPVGNHGAHPIRSAALVQHNISIPSTPSVQPLRIIFMRHSERANQALGPDWFFKAFRTKKYKAYDRNLPSSLPKRRFDQAYEFDAPLTVRGLKSARLTGRVMATNNYLADICLSSTALRCVQTCERILSGMERRDRIPLRIEPGLFECPHYNYKIVDSFMTKKELSDNNYNIKHDYRPIVSKVTVPETLDEYFERSHLVMRGIIDRYGPYGGTVLIVTHAPGLLALTDAIKGLKPNTETFYRNVATFPPLAAYIAEYDGTKWKYSEQPFNFVST